MSEEEEIINLARSISFYIREGVAIEKITHNLVNVREDKDVVIKALLVCLTGAY